MPKTHITKLGNVTHSYRKIGVNIVDLENSVKLGDKVRFERGGEPLFDQQIESMQIDHKPIKSAKAGQEVAIKSEKAVKENSILYKLEDE